MKIGFCTENFQNVNESHYTRKCTCEPLVELLMVQVNTTSKVFVKSR